MGKLNETDLSREFELAWKPSNCGLSSVLAFLSQYASRPYDAAMVCSLIQIDLERSWFAWDKQVQAFSGSSDCDDLLGQMRYLPRLTGYRSLLEDIQATASQYRQLVETEYEVRNQSGDMIGPAYYQMYFGIEVPDECGTELRRVYCSSSGHLPNLLAQGIPLRGLNLFGRRRTADDRNLHVEYRPEGNRVIIAPKDERRVSRIQASLQILTAEFACLRNEGNLNPLILLPGEPLKPGEARIVKFPFDLRLPNSSLKFR